MIICTNCKKELPDDARFCDGCGTKVEQDGTFIFCPACGSKISSKYEFCPECGSNIMQQLGDEKKQPGGKPKTRVKEKKIACILLVLVVLLGAGAGSVCLIRSRGKDYTNRLLYVKKNKLFMTDEKGENGGVLSKKLGENNENIFQTIGSDLCDYITVYKDDKRIVYPEKMSYVYYEDDYEDDEDSVEDYGYYEYSLYYRSLKDSDMEPVKIDSGIQNTYQVTKDGNRIFYQKDSGLYVYDFDKKEKIATDVKEYKINDDGSRVVYFCETGLYYKEDGKDKQKLSDSVCNNGSVFYVTGDFSKVYYVTEDFELCQTTVDGRESKIADKVSGMGDVQVYDSGELYYIVSEELKLKVADYITDDMSPSEPLTEPEYPEEPEYPDWDDYEDEAAYDKAYSKYEKKYKKWEAAYDEYLAAYEAYEAAAEQSGTIAAIMQAEFSVPKTTYYYYDGKTAKELGSVIGEYAGFEETSEKPAILFRVTENESLPNLDLSTAWQIGLSNETFYDMIEEGKPDFVVSQLESAFEGAAREDSEIRLAVGSVTQNLFSVGEVQMCSINSNGTCITYLEDNNLMQIEVKDGKAQKAVTYDTDVAVYHFLDDTHDDILYFKDCDDDKSIGDLYRNKVKIDEEVKFGQFSEDFCVVDDLIYYCKDFDAKSETATLMVYGGGKAKEIATDVFDFEVENQKLYYITDWDDGNVAGSVYSVEDDKPVKMADDVYQFYVLGDGSFYYLTDYDSDEWTSDLYRYLEKEDKLIESDVQGVMVPGIALQRVEEE